MTKELTIFKEIEDYQPLKVLFDNDKIGYEKYVASIFNKIKSTSDLQKCDAQSILTSIHNAKILGLEIDARQLCSLIPYAGKCTLQVEYKGYLYKMARYYKDFDYKISLIFKEDEFEVWSEGDNDCYKHKLKNPLAANANIAGVYFYYTYTVGGHKVSKIEYANVEQIKKAMEAAKTKNVWTNWFGEMAKKFIIKRACKSKSSSIPDLAKLDEFDNQDYDFRDVTPNSKTANAHTPQKLPENPPAAIEEAFNVPVSKMEAVNEKPLIIEPERPAALTEQEKQAIMLAEGNV
jgi:phage RecT family recombinase